ncbi:hypothetical protein [Paenibacillus xylaniclasticus]|nr:MULTISPECIES: hypothetical protein [Paenibacillus]GFN30486.1 hypothetical protein PCURB6_07460 [Paenibacillus curdlanolyticus]
MNRDYIEVVMEGKSKYVKLGDGESRAIKDLLMSSRQDRNRPVDERY